MSERRLKWKLDWKVLSRVPNAKSSVTVAGVEPKTLVARRDQAAPQPKMKSNESTSGHRQRLLPPLVLMPRLHLAGLLAVMVMVPLVMLVVVEAPAAHARMRQDHLSLRERTMRKHR